jgi:hypothetical protein
VFESGAWTEEGDLTVAPQPHRSTVSSGDQAVVYEAVLADENGRPTTLSFRPPALQRTTDFCPLGSGLKQSQTIRPPFCRSAPRATSSSGPGRT